MLDGYWTFNGEDVVNHARTEAYLRNGCKPQGPKITTGDDVCDVMVDFLNDGRVYETPLVDGAPWVESGDADTWDFAGPIITDITGTSGSTRTAEVAEFVGDGGAVTSTRYGTRTIAVTALLVGRTGASVEAGLAWLSTTLAGDCGPAGELCGFAACPDQYLDSPLLDADPITERLDMRTDGWSVSRGRFRSRDGWFDPDAAVTGAPARYGSGLYGFSTYSVGGPAYGEGTYGSSVYGEPEGLPEPSLAAPEQPCYAGPVVWAWNLSTVRGAVSVAQGALAHDGTVLSRSDAITVQGDSTLRFVPDPEWKSWVPVLWFEGQTNPVRIAPTITHQPYRTAEECADSYRRSYLDVSCTSGPTVVDKITFACGEYALKVEWTWVVGNPFVFGSITDLVSDYSTALLAADAIEPGVYPRSLGLVDLASVGYEIPEPPSPRSLVADPCAPGFVLPPSPPKITDAAWSPPDSWRRFTFSIPARLAPSNHDGLLSFEFTSDSRPKRGLRVRLYPDPLSRGLDGLDEYAYCSEINLTYLPPDATVVLDAARRRVLTTLPGLAPIDTASNVRGAGGAPFEFPALQCNTPYLVVVDVPDDYDRACGGYAAGDPQGDVRFAMSLRPATI